MKMTSLSAYFDIIYFGTTRHFVQCSSLIGIAKKEDMEGNFWNIGRPCERLSVNSQKAGTVVK